MGEFMKKRRTLRERETRAMKIEYTKNQYIEIPAYDRNGRGYFIRSALQSVSVDLEKLA